MLNTHQTVLMRDTIHTVNKCICRNCYSWIIHSYCFLVSGEGREGVAQWKRNKKSRLYHSLFESAIIWEHRAEDLLNMRQTWYLHPSFYSKIFWVDHNQESVCSGARCSFLLFMLFFLNVCCCFQHEGGTTPKHYHATCLHRERRDQEKNMALMRASLPQSALKQGSSRAPGSISCLSTFFIYKNKFIAIWLWRSLSHKGVL